MREDITTQQRPFHDELTGSALCGIHTNCEHARHGGFQTLDVEHRTDSRRPLDQPPGTTTETDEDAGKRRRGQTKTETDEDGDRLTLGTSELAAPLQLTTSQSEHNLILLLSRDPLTPELMKVAAVSASPGPVVEPPLSSCS